MQHDRYPENWKEIATKVKDEANWTCEECGKPCRKPGVNWMLFCIWLLNQGGRDGWYAESFEDVYNPITEREDIVEKPQRFTLTVAHLDHTPENCDRANLKALCAPCHNKYDAPNRAVNRKRNRQKRLEARGQLTLF